MEEENNIFSIVVADPTATVAKPPKITKTEKLQEKKTHKLEMKGEWAAKRKGKRIRKMQRQQELLAKLTPTQQKEYYDKIKQQEAFFMEYFANNKGSTQRCFYFDLEYTQHMNEIEINSLGIQLQSVVGFNKANSNPYILHMCNITSMPKEMRVSIGMVYWEAIFHEEPITEIKLPPNTYYLTPDAELPLGTLDGDENFILGGLVDKVVKKNLTLKKSEILSVPCRRLPIKENITNVYCLPRPLSTFLILTK